MKWIEALAAARAAQAEKPGKGFQSKADIQSALGCSQTQCERTLRRLMEAGMAERKCFRVVTPGGGVRNVAFFRLKKATK